MTNKTLAKRLLELNDLQNICVFSVFASRFKSQLTPLKCIIYELTEWAPRGAVVEAPACEACLPGSSTANEQPPFFSS